MSGSGKVIFICSPFGGEEHNAQKAREYCRSVALQGFVPVAMHLLLPQFMDEHNPEERAAAIRMNLTLLARCDEVWIYGDKITPGMAVEIQEAERLKKTARRMEETEGGAK